MKKITKVLLFLVLMLSAALCLYAGYAFNPYLRSFMLSDAYAFTASTIVFSANLVNVSSLLFSDSPGTDGEASGGDEDVPD